MEASSSNSEGLAAAFGDEGWWSREGGEEVADARTEEPLESRDGVESSWTWSSSESA